MKFTETPLQGAYLITPELLEDERGFFARSFCRHEFEAKGLDPEFVQCNISFSQQKGTLRGMHYQAHPYAEVKLVRCTTGAIYDVIIDIRAGSSTFRQWFAVRLTEDNRQMLYIPKGFAQGFQTLSNNTEVFYHHSAYYSPEHQRGLRFDDPAFKIAWPLGVYMISEGDRNHDLIDGNFRGMSV